MLRSISGTVCVLALVGAAGWVNACDSGTAVVSGGTHYPPLTWREGDVLVGSSIDVIRQILAEVGVKAVPDEGGPWKRVLRRAELGQVDILLGVRHSQDRDAYLAFVRPPITPSVQGVFHSVDVAFEYSDRQDLVGKVGSVTLGTNFDAGFDRFMREKLTVQPVPKIEQNFMKLEKKRVDYMLGPLVPTQLYLQQYGFADKIVATPTPLMTLDEFVAISRKSSCVKHLAHIEKRVKEYVESGKVNEVMEGYFLKWFESMPSP